MWDSLKAINLPWLGMLYTSNINGYGSIPINTIFRGMNIHLPAILMWTTGVQGFDTLPNGDLGDRLWHTLYHMTAEKTTLFFMNCRATGWTSEQVIALGHCQFVKNSWRQSSKASRSLDLPTQFII
jgi:hypothetical protein